MSYDELGQVSCCIALEYWEVYLHDTMASIDCTSFHVSLRCVRSFMPLFPPGSSS